MHTDPAKSPFPRLLNRCKDALFISPLLPFWRKRLNGKAMIYLYHRIQKPGVEPVLDKGGSPATSPHDFRRDIRALKKMGAKFIRFSDFANCEFKPDEFNVVVCADDGFASNFREGMQIADEEAIKLTVFQCSDMLSGGELIWEHQLYYLYFNAEHGRDFRCYLERRGEWLSDCDQIRETIHPQKINQIINDYLQTREALRAEMKAWASVLYPTENELRSAHQNQHEIASHGASHFKRALISREEFEQQLKSSKRRLEEIVGQPITAFSYPFNSYLPEDDLACSRYFTMVATVDGGPVSKNSRMLAMPRNTYPGHPKNTLRHRRWLLTGHI